MLVNALMGAPAPLFEHLLSGGLAQILVQILDENLDMALVERTLVSHFSLKIIDDFNDF